MTTQTKHLTGSALDRVIAHLFGRDPNTFHPTTDWSHGGPLLTADDGCVITVYEDPHWNQGAVGTERYLACTGIGIEDKEMGYGSAHTGAWTISDATFKGESTCLGSTYLEAAMRCLATSLVGEYVEQEQQ